MNRRVYRITESLCMLTRLFAPSAFHTVTAVLLVSLSLGQRASAAVTTTWEIVDRSPSTKTTPSWRAADGLVYEIQNAPFRLVCTDPQTKATKWQLDLGKSSDSWQLKRVDMRGDLVLVFAEASAPKYLFLLVDSAKKQVIAQGTVVKEPEEKIGTAGGRHLGALTLSADGKRAALMYLEWTKAKDDWTSRTDVYDLKPVQLAKRFTFKGRREHALLDGDVYLARGTDGIDAIELTSLKTRWTVPTPDFWSGDLLLDHALVVQTKNRLFKLDIATGKVKKTVTGDGSASESPKLTERGILAVFNGLTLYDRNLKLLAKGPLDANVLDFGIVKDRAYGYWYDKLTIFDASTLKPVHVVTNKGGWKFDTLQRLENDDVWMRTFAEAGTTKAYEEWHYGPVQSQTVNTGNLPKNASLFVEGQRLDPKRPLVRVGQRVIDVLVPNSSFISVPVTVTASAPVTLNLPTLPPRTIAEDSLVQTLPKGMSFATVLLRAETERKNGYIDTRYRGAEMVTNEGKSIDVSSVSTGRVKWTRSEDTVLRDLGVTKSKPSEFVEKHVARWLPRSNLVILVTHGRFPETIAAFDGATGALRWRFNTSSYTGWAEGVTSDDVTVEEHLGVFWYWAEGRFYAHSITDGHLMWELIAPGPGASISTPVFLADRVVFVSNDSVFAMSLLDGSAIWKTSASHETRINRGPKPDMILVTEATRIRLMDTNGKVLATNSSVRGSPQQVRPVIASDFIFVCGHKLNYAYALDASTLKQRWSYKADPIESVCVTAIADDEALASEKTKNYVLDRKTGKLKKELTTKLNEKGQVIVDGNAICFATHNRHGCFGQP